MYRQDNQAGNHQLCQLGGLALEQGDASCTISGVGKTLLELQKAAQRRCRWR